MSDESKLYGASQPNLHTANSNPDQLRGTRIGDSAERPRRTAEPIYVRQRVTLPRSSSFSTRAIIDDRARAQEELAAAVLDTAEETAQDLKKHVRWSKKDSKTTLIIGLAMFVVGTALAVIGLLP